ncbi:MAG: hypothetical protein U0930_26495 [Pirellulales bacterium]
MARKIKVSQDLKNEVTDSAIHYHWWWRCWNTIATTLALVAIISSFVASIMAASKTLDSYPLASAFIAGLPALILTIDKSLKSRERADWFWSFVLRYQEVERALRRNDIDANEALRRIDNIERTGDLTDPTKAGPIRSDVSRES